jgi:hypothetical protein
VKSKMEISSVETALDGLVVGVARKCRE